MSPVYMLVMAFGCAVIAAPVAAEPAGRNMTASTGWELHNALATPEVTLILITANITLTLDTCPFPSSDAFVATIVSRNVTISSLPAASSSSSRQAGAAAAPPYWINCNYLTDRLELKSGYKITLSHLVLLNCRTWSLAGVFRKAAGAVVHLDHILENFGQVCLPGQTQYQGAANAPRPAGIPPPGGGSSSSSNAPQRQQQQQWLQLSDAGANWCQATAAGRTGNSSNSSALAFPFEPPVAANSSNPMCSMQALLLGDIAIETAATNTSNGTKGQPFIFYVTNSAAVCTQPVSEQCLQDKTADDCLSAAYEEVNPDLNGPCPATDGYSLQSCLMMPSVRKIMLLQFAQMNLSTSPAQQQPAPIDRDVTIFSDLRSPRIMWDCGSLSNRFQLAANITLTLNHIVLANCSTTKPVSIIRMSAGSRVLVNDTLIVQPPGLCLPLNEQGGLALHNPRPVDLPGVQSLNPAGAGAWCQLNDSRTVAQSMTSPADNSSYSAIAENKIDLGLFANTTGFGPAYAATLSDPASVPYYVNPTWPSINLCSQQALLLVDYAEQDPYGWVNGAPPAAAATAANSNATQQPPQQHQQQQGPTYGSDVDLTDGSYSGNFTIHYLVSALLCPQPLSAAACAGMDPSNVTGCLAAAYDRLNPDHLMLPGSAAYAAAAAHRHGNHGVQVVLPAVLASVLGAALVVGLVAAGLLIQRRRRPKGSSAAIAAPVKSWLDGTATTDTPASSNDPARQLLGMHKAGSPDGSGDTARQPGTSSLASSAPDGIILRMLLGAGSFGRVFAGTWNGSPVAVKIITHSSADDSRISQELALSLSFDHPNLVRALHFTKLRINPHSPETSMGTPSADGSSLFLPEGAVGVFSLPSTWAIIQRSAQGGPGPQLDTETWIVMDLMDRGNLAAALRHTNLFVDGRGVVNMARLLRRAADVAAGLSYLHSRNVCHGDLKWENVLLKSEARDPDGVMAKVADFGLSRALAFGQSHLSTRRYGTVTHMPPELLVAGKLTPSADVYSFGICMWELVSRALPFHGLHHGEVIHRVVTEDLRPGPWPQASAQLPLPAGYIPLAEACWARQATARPSMPQVLQRLLDMLAEVERAAELGV